MTMEMGELNAVFFPFSFFFLTHLIGRVKKLSISVVVQWICDAREHQIH